MKGPKPRAYPPGYRFGRGVVIEEIRMTPPPSEAPHRRSIRGFRLLCDCGAIYEVRLANLTSKRPTKSCGCLQRELAVGHHPTHGLRNHPLYATWKTMMHRCYHPNATQFEDWGGRGIAVCERWHDVSMFIADIESTIGLRPSTPRMVLDRIDNDGNYEPGNVKWSTYSESNRNQRRRRGKR